MRLCFLICVSDGALLRANAMASPCLREGPHEVVMVHGCRSAADGFSLAAAMTRLDWIVFLHQDVFLPPGWDEVFGRALTEAAEKFPRLGVVGVYGIARDADGNPIRAGVVRDRDLWLREPAPLPCEVESLDELLFAVRRDAGLSLDPRLGFDLCATDLVLSAREKGWQAAVVHAPCHHNATWPRTGIPASVLHRFGRAARLFVQKWEHALPVHTPSWSFTDLRSLPPLPPP